MGNREEEINRYLVLAKFFLKITRRLKDKQYVKELKIIILNYSLNRFVPLSSGT